MGQRVAIYGRVSTEDQNCERQEREDQGVAGGRSAESGVASGFDYWRYAEARRSDPGRPRRRRAIAQGEVISPATTPNEEWSIDFKG
jgi:hypothetical protein